MTPARRRKRRYTVLAATGVAEVAHQLQEKGYLDYTRGTITIRNRQGIEEACCECYQMVRREWDRLGLKT